MKVNVKNLGAINDCTIDLSKRLTVFCGENNTGKTYLSYLLYAITSMENKSFGVRLDRKYIDSLLETNAAEISLDISQMFRFKQKENSKLKPNLWKLFAIPESKSEDFFGTTEINFLEEEEAFTARIQRLRLDDTIMFLEFTLRIQKETDHSIIISIPEEVIKNEALLQFLDVILLSLVYSKLIYYPILSSTIFPVERNSIFTFNRELSIKNNHKYDLIKELSSNEDFNPIELLLKRPNRYPQPIRECLKVADDLDVVKKTNSAYYAFAEAIENELLEGSVVISKDGSVEFSSNKTAKKHSLSFHQSSSIVKTLAGLVIYLKHSAQLNDLVIMDEPELNLHPNNQIKLMRILAKLVNKGLNLVISTHSDYILREINNLIMLSSDDKDIVQLKQVNGFAADEFLNKADLAVHYFHYKTLKQADVTPLEVTEFGFSVPSIDDAIQKQNKLTDDLYYTLRFGAKYKGNE